MSKHTLISFLGKSKLNQQTGYRKANYDFGNGILKEVSFFGIGLTEVLKPHKLILIGTAGSMWDVFFAVSKIHGFSPLTVDFCLCLYKFFLFLHRIFSNFLLFLALN